jgi:hypothetical protein
MGSNRGLLKNDSSPQRSRVAGKYQQVLWKASGLEGLSYKLRFFRCLSNYCGAAAKQSAVTVVWLFARTTSSFMQSA